MNRWRPWARANGSWLASHFQASEDVSPHLTLECLNAWLSYDGESVFVRWDRGGQLALPRAWCVEAELQQTEEALVQFAIRFLPEPQVADRAEAAGLIALRLFVEPGWAPDAARMALLLTPGGSPPGSSDGAVEEPEPATADELVTDPSQGRLRSVPDGEDWITFQPLLTAEDLLRDLRHQP